MEQHEQVLNKLLHKIAVEQKYEQYDLKVSPLSTGGANFTSNLFLATITSTNKSDLSLFAKVAAIGEKFRSQTPYRIFETEQIIYSKLMKVYKQLEDEHNVPEEHRLVFPKLYGYHPVVPEETIVLENLASKGFVTYDRFKSIDWEYAAAAVGELAKLHALSIALQHDRPEEFTQVTTNLKFTLTDDDEIEMEAFVARGTNVALSVLKEEHKDKFKRYFDTLDSKTFMAYYIPSYCTVISHGDFRPSNLLHQVHDDGTVQVIPIDYQTMQIGSPIVDLLYFIFTGSDEQFRRQHFQQIIDHYHAQLSLALRKLDLDPDEKYSKKEFENELKEKLLFGLAIAVCSLPIVTVESENAPKVNEDLELSSFSIQNTSELFSERLNGIVNDYVKWGVLK